MRRRVVPSLAPSSAAFGLLALVAAALVGCASPQPAGTAPPSPSTTASDPPSSPEPTTSASPSPGPSVTPSAAPTDAPEALRSCGDAFVVERTRIEWWPGSADQQLAQAMPEGTFVPAGALDGLDVVCTVTYRAPTDGEPGVVHVSEAIVERDEGALDRIEAWAVANGYAAQESGEWHQPPEADGTTTRTLFWVPLDHELPMVADAPHLIEVAGAEPDAVYLWHADFTRE